MPAPRLPPWGARLPAALDRSNDIMPQAPVMDSAPGSGTRHSGHRPREPTTTRLAWVPFLCLLVLSAAGRVHAEDWLYTVRPGDNLWDLAAEFTKSAAYWRRLQSLNHVTQPKRIPPGTQLRFPLAWLKVHQTAVRVISVFGTVEAVSTTHGTRVLRPGEELHAGDQVRTGQDGIVVLEFADGARLRLLHQGHLVLERLNAYGDRKVPDIRIRVTTGETRPWYPIVRVPVNAMRSVHPRPLPGYAVPDSGLPWTRRANCPVAR